MSTYLVTGASGNIGRSVSATLLSKGHKVHGYVRNPESKAAQDLASLGVVLFKGDFSNKAALSAASKGCSGVFILTIPGPEAASNAQNVVASFRSSCLPDPVVVLVTSIWQIDVSTKLLHSPNSGLPNKPPHPFVLGYWEMNNAVETVIKEGGIPHWTILQPGNFMSNYKDQAVKRIHWPTLSSEKTLVSGARPDTLLDLVDPHDIGVFAAHALVEKGQPRWEHKSLCIVSEFMTLEEKAATISRVTGVDVKAVFRDEKDAAKMAEDDFIGYLHFWQRRLDPVVDIEEMRSYGFQLGTFEAYLTKHREAMINALNDVEEARAGLTADELLSAAGQHGQ